MSRRLPALLLALTILPQVRAQVFSDVPASHWAAKAVSELRSASILHGYPATQSEDEDYDRKGKSWEQILAMGRDKWFKFATESDNSTAGMSNASLTFGRALERRNDKLLKAAPSKTKTRVKKLRELLGSYGRDMLDLGSAETGGGTMWNSIGAGMSPDIEEVVYLILGGNVAKSPAAVVSKVTKEHDQIRKQIRSHGKDDVVPYNKAENLKTLSHAEATFKSIVAVAKDLPRSQSDAILDYCASKANMPLGMGEGK